MTVPVIDTQYIEYARENELPSSAEQLDLYVLYLGDCQKHPSSSLIIHTTQYLRAKIGAVTVQNVSAIAQWAGDLGIAEISPGDKTLKFGATLVYRGWQRYEELKRGKASGTTAFLAMAFKDSEDQDFIKEHFTKAVAETGFRLRDIREDPKAGLIDNHIRVAIRMARFVIADLTHRNKGAYWEAGYAEGLGKPVIYSCRRDVFESEHPDIRPHFDTNHCQTVVWDPKEPEKAVAQLADTIRATLPFDAKMPKEDV